MYLKYTCRYDSYEVYLFMLNCNPNGWKVYLKVKYINLKLGLNIFYIQFWKARSNQHGCRTQINVSMVSCGLKLSFFSAQQ